MRGKGESEREGSRNSNQKGRKKSDERTTKEKDGREKSSKMMMELKSHTFDIKKKILEAQEFQERCLLLPTPPLPL